MKRLFRNWDVLRVIRLLSGAVFAAYGIYASDSLTDSIGRVADADGYGELVLLCGRRMWHLVREQSIV